MRRSTGAVRRRIWGWGTAATTLSVGVALAAIVPAEADSDRSALAPRAQQSAQAGVVGPVDPMLKWRWTDPRYAADGAVGGTSVSLAAALDDAGELLFKARNTDFDDTEGPDRYDMLALDPETGQERLLLDDVVGDQCAPAVAPDGIVWTFQSINRRTDPATGSNPGHGIRGHEHLVHASDTTSWLVGIDPVTASVVHRIEGGGEEYGPHADKERYPVRSCMTRLQFGADGSLVFLDSPRTSGFDHWLRIHSAGGQELRDIHLHRDHAATASWADIEGSLMLGQEGSASAGVVYLPYYERDGEDGRDKRPALAALDPGADEFRTIELPRGRFRTSPVMDPAGGIVVSLDGPRGTSNGSGHLLRVVDDGSVLSVDWSRAIDVKDPRRGLVPRLPDRLHAAGSHVVSWAGGDLVSFRWADGRLRWVRDPGTPSTKQVVVDAAGNAYLALRGAGADPRLRVVSARGKTRYALSGRVLDSLRTVGPLAPDGTLYGWGKEDNTWYAVVDATVRCPRGTSTSVHCTRNPAGGYVMTGTRKREKFVGSKHPDKLVGKGGKDTLRGRGGEDLLIGGKGRDTFRAGAGADTIRAHGQRKERVNCGKGRDTVKGARGDRVARNCERVKR